MHTSDKKHWIQTSSHYQEKSSASEIKSAANEQMHHSDGLKF